MRSYQQFLTFLARDASGYYMHGEVIFATVTPYVSTIAPWVNHLRGWYSPRGST